MSDYQLAPGEKVLRVVKKHWINILPVFVSSGLIALALLVMVYVLGRYSATIAKYVPSGLVGLVMLVLAGVAIATSLLGYWIYNQNKLILTTQHLIEITQVGLFSRTVSQLSLAKVQDVSSSKRGLMATILGFGDVTIETAGEEDNFVFHQLMNPPGLCQEILKAHEKLVKNPANDAL